MRWSDTGIIVAINKSSESSLIIAIFTNNHGLHRGYCAFNKKSMPTLQVGNIVAVTWNARLSTHLGRFQLELVESVPAFFLHDFNRMVALSAISRTVEKILPERELHQKVYDQYYMLIQCLKRSESWTIHYIKLELIILEELGFGLDFSHCPINNTTIDLAFISPKTGRVISEVVGRPYKEKLLNLPKVLRQIHYDHLSVVSLGIDFAECLTITSYFLYKHCFHPHNIDIPIERQLLYDAYRRN